MDGWLGVGEGEHDGLEARVYARSPTRARRRRSRAGWVVMDWGIRRRGLDGTKGGDQCAGSAVHSCVYRASVGGAQAAEAQPASAASGPRQEQAQLILSLSRMGGWMNGWTDASCTYVSMYACIHASTRHDTTRLTDCLLADWADPAVDFPLTTCWSASALALALALALPASPLT